jgi:hypothetical protein
MDIYFVGIHMLKWDEDNIDPQEIDAGDSEVEPRSKASDVFSVLYTFFEEYSPALWRA